MNQHTQYIICVLSVILLSEISLLIMGLSVGNVFSDGILQIKTINAIFLVQISFNLNYYLIKLYCLFGQEKPLYTNDLLNISLINILMLLIFITISSIEYSLHGKFDNRILIYSIWTTTFLQFSKKFIDNYNYKLKIHNSIDYNTVINILNNTENNTEAKNNAENNV